MPQLTRCPHCKKPVQLADDSAGKTLRCPLCRKVFRVAAQPVREPAAAAARAAGSPSVAPRPPRAVPAAPEPRPPATPRAPGPAECPACRATLLAGAVACMECGYLLQGDDILAEGHPNLCANPACGVANGPKDRVCQRCGTPLPTPAGTVLHGRYRVDRQLAVGGFGAVYLATDLKQHNRAVAIKDMICADPQEFTIRLNFFRREAEILRSLQSLPVVPRVYDFIQQGQTAHLVMEYIRGQDLLKVMEANGNWPFPVDQVIDWGLGVCDVLTHMHSQSPPLIHRDLKPDNIMLLDDGSGIKMIDFGTARDLGRSHRTRLAAKTRVYTEGYAPPEQIIGKPEARSDLFALAGTMYHLATSKAPEGFYTARELQAQLEDPQGPLPADQRWFFEVIRINLAEDANDRYFSAREIRHDLERRQVTRDVACPACRAINPVREPYCRQCAAPLTDPTPPCTHCGKANRMGSRCCIHCGNRLR